MPGGREAGFTLIELMISVAIVGVLSSAAIPAFVRYMEKARDVEALESLAKITDGASAYYQATGSMPTVPEEDAAYTGPDKVGSGYGPDDLLVCAHHGRATPADIELYFHTQADKQAWGRLQFAPGSGARFTYTYLGWSKIGAAEARMTAHRIKNCDLSLMRRIQYSMKLTYVGGDLRRDGPRLDSD